MTSTRSLTLGRAWDLAGTSAEAIRTSHPAIEAVLVAGDLRRFESFISSIDLVVRASAQDGVLEAIACLPDIEKLTPRSQGRASGLYKRAPLNVFVASSRDHGSVLFEATGSTEHARRVSARIGSGDRYPDYPTEEALYAAAGLAFIPPELRHGGEEIERAAEGPLPRLVEASDMRGDLHMHTTFSDGRDPLDTMVEGCDALGYEYIAITDHSPGAAAARTLDRDSIARQRDEIERLRERFPRMVILHGCEVDILLDGRLDLDDQLLESFDIILTSLHERDGQDGDRLTARSIAAIRHPLVNVLCHPANQLVGTRGGYPMDFDAIYEAAAETGTALEIDGAPSHLDLDGEHARAAVAAGVTLTIDSDCHRVEALGRQMAFGTGLARRGWVEPGNVLNTRSIEEVRRFIQAKRT